MTVGLCLYVCVIARYQQSLLTLNESSSQVKATDCRQNTPQRYLYKALPLSYIYPACLAFTGYAPPAYGGSEWSAGIAM